MLYIPHTRWGGIRQICVPSAVFKQGTLNLSPPALAVLLVLIQIRKHKPKIARMNETKVTVRVGYKTLIARTGYSQNIITKAIHELTTLQFIQVVKSDRKKHGEFAIQQYILCDPTDGTPLESSEPDVYVNGSRL